MRRQEWDYDILAKILVIGDSAVGKSCLLTRYADDTFTETHMTTIGVDFKLMTHYRDGKTIKMQIWDTAGQDRFRTITEAYYRGAHGILLVYDTTNRESFQNVKTWLDDVKKHQGDQKSALILVGNKTDLKHRRKITTEEGEELAKELELDAFIETSAKSGDCVQQAFELILEEVLRNQNYLQPTRDGKIRINPPKPEVKPQKTSFWSWCSIL